jgi:hypothetical protein
VLGEDLSLDHVPEQFCAPHESQRGTRTGSRRAGLDRPVPGGGAAALDLARRMVSDEDELGGIAAA